MTVNQIYCRDFGHAWEPFTAHRVKGGGYDQVLRCGRCTTQRRRALDRYGDPVHSRYDYADGYQIKGLGRITGTDKGQLRIAAVERMIDTHPGMETD